MNASERMVQVVRLCRERPDETLVRCRINGSRQWVTLSGAAFLEAWEEPFGTLDVDGVYVRDAKVTHDRCDPA